MSLEIYNIACFMSLTLMFIAAVLDYQHDWQMTVRLTSQELDALITQVKEQKLANLQGYRLCVINIFIKIMFSFTPYLNCIMPVYLMMEIIIVHLFGFEYRVMTLFERTITWLCKPVVLIVKSKKDRDSVE